MKRLMLVAVLALAAGGTALALARPASPIEAYQASVDTHLHAAFARLPRGAAR